MLQYTTQLALFDQVQPKRCNVCQQVHPATSEFWHARKASKDGLCLTCKECANGRSRNWQHDNREYANAKALEYYQTHKAEHRAYQQAHAEHRRALKRSPEYRAKAAELRKRKLAELRDYNRNYRATHEWNDDWRQRNPENRPG